MKIQSEIQNTPVATPEAPPLPGGGSWRLVDNKWVPADAAPAPAAVPQSTEE